MNQKYYISIIFMKNIIIKKNNYKYIIKKIIIININAEMYK
jgi:hypothetical protein